MNNLSVPGRAVWAVVAPVTCAAGVFFALAPASQLATASRVMTTAGLVGLVIIAIVAIAWTRRISDAGPDDPGPGGGQPLPGRDDGPAAADDGFDAELRALLDAERSRAVLPPPHLN